MSQYKMKAILDGGITDVCLYDKKVVWILSQKSHSFQMNPFVYIRSKWEDLGYVSSIGGALLSLSPETTHPFIFPNLITNYAIPVVHSPSHEQQNIKTYCRCQVIVRIVTIGRCTAHHCTAPWCSTKAMECVVFWRCHLYLLTLVLDLTERAVSRNVSGTKYTGITIIYASINLDKGRVEWSLMALFTLIAEQAGSI